jgi:archaellum component FlaC
MNWLEEATPKEVREKILSRSDTANVKDMFEDCLYEADFIHLANFLFKEYSTISIEDLIKNISKAKKIEDIKLKDLKELIPKSNWDRYFSKIIKFAGLNSKWKELYEYRNLVAHNRPLNKSNYQRIEILTSEIKEKITDAIKKIDDVHIPENKKKEVTDFAISDFMKSTPSRLFNSSSVNDISGIVNLGSTFISGGYQDSIYTGSFHNPLLSSNANCISCGKTYIKSVLLGTHITGKCDECSKGITYSPFLNNKICISCGNSFMLKPGEFIFTNECENCRFGDKILVTNSNNSK